MDATKQVSWDVFFASVVSITLHPGYTKEGMVKPTIEDCAKMADAMMLEREKRVKEGA